MKKILSIFLCLVLLLGICGISTAADEQNKTLRILFTHDIHSYFIPSGDLVDGKYREHGGAARLKTLLDNNSGDNSVYLDAGDFSMGTLLQAGFSTDAYELRILGELGCDVTTLGNHEFDYGDSGLALMLANAKKSGDRLPELVQSNMITDGVLTEEQRELTNAFNWFGGKKYTVLEKNGLKIAVFGLFGRDCLECSPTAKVEFTDYLESAKTVTAEIKSKENPDVIICLSHAGTNGDGATGEDIDLAKAVPEINVIISGHTHTTYQKPVTVGETLIVSAGEYLNNLGLLDINVVSGKVSLKKYELLPCDETVPEDEETAQKIAQFKRNINKTYLKDEGADFDKVICHSDFDFITLKQMEKNHGENPFGNLIADSYIYEAKRNGVNDIDVAIVGLGTIRGSFSAGDITTADAFEICSLGVGADGSAGHPIIAAYITGSELKLLAELDASLGPMISYIKMSYSGLNMTFNTKRVLLDRVTDVYLVREDGSTEQIIDDKLYKVACNMYAANMLGMLNGLTAGILQITPKFADGTPVENFYDCSLKTKDGKEIKEWVAFKDYLSSFEKIRGVPHIPQKYAAVSGRKNKITESGFVAIKGAGITTKIVIAVPLIALAVIVILLVNRNRIKIKRQAKKLKRLEKKAAKEQNKKI
ncbi:MAG: bifunctional metallophosphatase/5'-nucleotidase [Clostridiales bacterium]|nr:bifunctional metallophosphatase/5'-nucleotidase [Candidatus Equinaster intestinalis]